MTIQWPTDELVKKIFVSFIVAGFVIGIATTPPPIDSVGASASTSTSINTAVESESTNTTGASASQTGGKTNSPSTSSTTSTTQTSTTRTQSVPTQRERTIQPGASLVYVALGDSVASGAGLSEAANASAEDQVCDRSPQAYPYLIAQQLQTDVTHLACSGAKIDEGIYSEQRRSGTEIPVQLDRAFINGTPDVITMTIGANDVRWTSFIRQCYAVRCGSSIDEARAKIYRGDLRLELYRALNQIEQRSDTTPPRVLLSGYYDPFVNLDCVAVDRITMTEAAWLRQQSADLNQAIRSVVPYFDFVEYVPISFAGHELCAESSWIQGADGEAPFHPTAEGQAAIAEAFLNRLQTR